MDESRECSSPATETLKSYKFIMKHFGNKTNKTKIVVIFNDEDVMHG